MHATELAQACPHKKLFHYFKFSVMLKIFPKHFFCNNNSLNILQSYLADLTNSSCYENSKRGRLIYQICEKLFSIGGQNEINQ